MTSNGVEFPITILDQFGQPLKKFESGIDNAAKKVKGLNSAMTRTKGAHDNLNRSIAQLKANVERYRKAAENSFRTDHVRKYKMLIEETEKKIKELEESTDTCGKKSEGFFGKLKENFGIGKGMLSVAAAAKAAKVVYSMGKEWSEAAQQVEVYEVSLKNMLGSSSAARDRMQEYYQIAAKTPFDLQQVVEGGNKLQALGKYSKENLIMLGDLAAASGKPMEQALSAYAKMASGQKGIAVDMFRDLMITTDDWVKATGKGLDKSGSLKATTAEMLEALPKIMEAKGYLGMMASQANTTSGKIANLEDGIFQLKAALGDRLNPTVSNFAVKSANMVDNLRRWVEIPVAQKIAQEKIELNALVGVLTDATSGEDERARAIDELQSKYPDFLENMNTEALKAEDLRDKLSKVNEEYDKKMRKAVLSSRIEAVEAKMADKMDDIVGYELSINAKKTKADLSGQADSILAKYGLKGYSSALSTISYYVDDKGDVIELARNTGGVTPSVTKRKVTAKITDINDKTALAFLGGQMAAADTQINWFGNDEKRLAKAQQDYEQYKAEKDSIQKFVDEQFPVTEEAVAGDGSGGGGGGGTSGTTVETAAATISGGGSKVKNFYINIGNLLGENTNIFQSSDDNPETADAFMDKLSTALQMVVNDVNYVS